MEDGFRVRPGGWAARASIFCCALMLADLSVLQCQTVPAVLSEEPLFVFVIPTFSKKSSVLDSLSRLEHATTRSRRIEKQLSDLLAERRAFEKALTSALHDHFDFAPYALLHDSQLQAWRQGSFDVPDHTGAVVSHSRPGTVLVVKGHTPNGANALVMHTLDMASFDRPVPYFVRLSSITSLFNQFFGASGTWRDLDQAIARWSGKLKKYNRKLLSEARYRLSSSISD